MKIVYVEEPPFFGLNIGLPSGYPVPAKKYNGDKFCYIPHLKDIADVITTISHSSEQDVLSELESKLIGGADLVILPGLTYKNKESKERIQETVEEIAQHYAELTRFQEEYAYGTPERDGWQKERLEMDKGFRKIHSETITEKTKQMCSLVRKTCPETPIYIYTLSGLRISDRMKKTFGDDPLINVFDKRDFWGLIEEEVIDPGLLKVCTQAGLRKRLRITSNETSFTITKDGVQYELLHLVFNPVNYNGDLEKENFSALMISKLIFDLKRDPEEVYNHALKRFGVGTKVDREAFQASSFVFGGKELSEVENVFCHIRPDIRMHLYGRYM